MARGTKGVRGPEKMMAERESWQTIINTPMTKPMDKAAGNLADLASARSSEASEAMNNSRPNSGFKRPAR